MNATLFAPGSPLLVEQVEQAILSRTGSRVRGLRIHYVDGCVIISGRTSTYYNKQLVTHAAMEVADDAHVMNEVEVC